MKTQPQHITQVDTKRKRSEQARVLMGLLCYSYQWHSALSEIVSLVYLRIYYPHLKFNQCSPCCVKRTRSRSVREASAFDGDSVK